MNEGGSSPGGQEVDRAEAFVRRLGCWEQHLAVLDCIGETRDWRQCQDIVTLRDDVIGSFQLAQFRVCMEDARKKQQNQA